jgi:hypothetical protein
MKPVISNRNPFYEIEIVSASMAFNSLGNLSFFSLSITMALLLLK